MALEKEFESFFCKTICKLKMYIHSYRIIKMDFSALRGFIFDIDRFQKMLRRLLEFIYFDKINYMPS